MSFVLGPGKITVTVRNCSTWRLAAAQLLKFDSNSSSLSFPEAGNMKFRKLVEQFAPVYISADTKYDKTNVIATLIEKIRGDSPNGGFVKKDLYSGRWYEIGIERARDKVGHAVRKAADEVLRQREGKGKKGRPNPTKVLVELKARTTSTQQQSDIAALVPGAGITSSQQQSDVTPLVRVDAQCSNSQSIYHSEGSKPQHPGEQYTTVHGTVASDESLTPQELLLALGAPMNTQPNPLSMAPMYSYEEWHHRPIATSMNVLPTTSCKVPVPNPMATTAGTSEASLSSFTTKNLEGSSRDATGTIANNHQYHSVSHNDAPSSMEPHRGLTAPSHQARYASTVTHYQQSHISAAPLGEYPFQFLDQHFSTYPTGQGTWSHSFDYIDLSSPQHENNGSGPPPSSEEGTEHR